MRPVLAIARREIASYFATPIALVFVVVFLLLQGLATFELGQWLERDQADLAPFFGYLPWVLLLLVPALTMRLWAEDRRSGAIELLLTLPVTATQAVCGKFLAAWAMCLAALVCTLPFVVTVNILGSPDNGTIACGYFGAALLCAGFVALGGAASALTRNQVVAFVGGLALCLLFAAIGLPSVSGFLTGPAPWLAAAGRHLSIATRFETLSRGLLALPDLLWFAAFVGFWLTATVVTLDLRRSA